MDRCPKSPHPKWEVAELGTTPGAIFGALKGRQVMYIVISQIY